MKLPGPDRFAHAPHRRLGPLRRRFAGAAEEVDQSRLVAAYLREAALDRLEARDHRFGDSGLEAAVALPVEAPERLLPAAAGEGMVDGDEVPDAGRQVGGIDGGAGVGLGRLELLEDR